jgi:hypothetical protein
MPEISPRLTVRFASPQFTIHWRDNQEPLTVAWISLVPGPMHTQKSRRHERVMSAGPVRVETVYHYWDWDFASLLDFLLR